MSASDQLRLSPAFSIIQEKNGVIFRSDLETFRVNSDTCVSIIRNLLEVCDRKIDRESLVAGLSPFDVHVVEGLLDTLISRGVILNGVEKRNGWNAQLDFFRLWHSTDRQD